MAAGESIGLLLSLTQASTGDADNDNSIIVRKTIEKMIIEGILSHTSEVSHFGQGSVIRALITAFAATQDELFYDIVQTRRKLLIATASDTDLDDRAKDYNMERLEAAAAGTVLVFQGTPGTVIPATTQVKSASGVIFETVDALTLGVANSPYDTYPSEYLTDKVEAIANTTGESGNVPANSITTLVTPITGVDSVTNPSHAINGRDAEQDNELRTRIIERILLLNQGTLKFYEAVAREINPEILRVYATRGSAEREVAIYVANRSGTGLSAADLTDLENNIRTYAPICAVPQCYNITFTDVDVYARISLKTGYTLQDVFESMTKALAEFIDWSRLDFGITIDDADILSIVNDTIGVNDVDLSSFRPNANIVCSSNSIPKLGTITLINMHNISDTINYSPATTYIYRYD